MIDLDIHQLILSLKYFGILILLILNGAFNFPSSQIIYLITGYFVSVGKLSFVPVIIVGAIGNTIGNLIVYKIVYKYGENAVRKFLFIKKETLNETLTKLNKELSNRGVWWLFLGKLIPSIKVFVPAVAGIAKINYPIAILVFFLGSLVWATIVNYIGYEFGENITLKGYALVMSIIGIIVMYITYKKLKHKR